MTKSAKGFVIATIILVVAVVAAACSSPPASQQEGTSPLSPSVPASPSIPQPTSGPSLKGPSNGLVQSSTGGGVTIDVEWMGPENGTIVFDVAMNTHSVDLDRYDLGEVAVLRDDAGKEYHPSSWRSNPGGHHRSGTLTFPIPDSLSQGKARYLQLIIRDVAGVKERVLKWELT